ncbi:hypothetical protein COU91_01635 [Candidatus Saccharibacteria bacterium CG10_big_fil_rev_8_21_14_0_10_47_8]|nr:MAG: hypothetical protein COU91_01635 [Candidatus Saccharibacteria bacterium CG10_big_fil_rev_8_21_14_0_10_47_8]
MLLNSAFFLLFQRSKFFCYLGRQGSAHRWAAFFLDAISGQNPTTASRTRYAQTALGREIVVLTILLRKKPMPRPIRAPFSFNLSLSKVEPEFLEPAVFFAQTA